MPAADETVARAERLCAVLIRAGDAMVALDARTLLETEEQIAQLVAALPASGSRVEDAVALTAAVRRSREAVLRCRRLGASFSAVARVRLGLCAGQATYNRVGEPAAGTSGSTVRVTV